MCKYCESTVPFYSDNGTQCYLYKGTFVADPNPLITVDFSFCPFCGKPMFNSSYNMILKNNNNNNNNNSEVKEHFFIR